MSFLLEKLIVAQLLRNCVISGFRRELDETCVLLGYYVACSGNSLPTFQDNLSVPILKGQESTYKMILDP